MKSISVELSAEFREIEIIPIADTHVGDPLADEKLFRKRVEYVRTTENAFAILNGDLGNFANKNSPSDIYGEHLSPMKQIARITDIVKPIRDKVLAVTTGNHEARIYRNDGVDITRLICRELGLEDRYSEGAAIVFIRFGRTRDGRKESNGSGETRKMCYTLFMNHGSGGGRKEGAKAIRLADMASIIDADVYVHSHTHLGMVMKQSFFRIDARNDAYRPVEKLFVNTGAHLDYAGYAEIGEFKPAGKANPHIFLCGSERRMDARL